MSKSSMTTEISALVEETPAGSAVIRTYASADRAFEDQDLLKRLMPERTFIVLPVEHIDN